MSEEREAMEPMDLHDYLDGRMTPEEKARFERELAADPELSDRLRELRELDKALGTLPGHAAPPDFTDRVVRAARRPRGGILRLAIRLGAVAAAAVLALVLMRKPEAPAPLVDAYTWETDVETYGSLALTDLEDQILEELEGT